MIIYRPTPSIADLETAVHSFCESFDWDHVVANFMGKHAFTSNNQMNRRCFQGLYLITLLKQGFGFEDSYSGINFAPSEGSNVAAVDWPLGFLLMQLKLSIL